MVILGAGGFAKEIATVLLWNNYKKENIVFFDNINESIDNSIYNNYLVIRSEKDLYSYFKSYDPKFHIGVGGTRNRSRLLKIGEKNAGILTSIISSTSLISPFDTNITLDKGISILSGVTITASVQIGIGCLVNKNAILSHDVEIKDFVEISPGAKLLGHSKVGSFTSIGTNAVILPNIHIGNNCIIGAGSIVTKNIPDDSIAVGIPAKVIKKNSHHEKNI
ncbi:NeuD/PglB/VioB family sugar acetyltransferase [Proteus mirabilis]|uniref:NeuD/PglB/VioB family sugar acetyltransferase n=1 Tax=Proteus mirabilis TaxID=584 RepID=UPI0013FD8710|nr:NeuD/PglB/VioB family sugar acetyltransferase [Proteus mirabilis]MDF7266874.1 NeuD/PglB/VioB family sugar acetyltransferase [Proteus mirabilis]NHI96637.1 hypothetical protein [Proteus mirabilis]